MWLNCFCVQFCNKSDEKLQTAFVQTELNIFLHVHLVSLSCMAVQLQVKVVTCIKTTRNFTSCFKMKIVLHQPHLLLSSVMSADTCVGVNVNGDDDYDDDNKKLAG